MTKREIAVLATAFVLIVLECTAATLLVETHLVLGGMLWLLTTLAIGSWAVWATRPKD